MGPARPPVPTSPPPSQPMVPANVATIVPPREPTPPLTRQSTIPSESQPSSGEPSPQLPDSEKEEGELSEEEVAPPIPNNARLFSSADFDVLLSKAKRAINDVTPPEQEGTTSTLDQQVFPSSDPPELFLQSSSIQSIQRRQSILMETTIQGKLEALRPQVCQSEYQLQKTMTPLP
ncbi:uncharacterized protein LOC128349879 [Hemicordylus capensis]|uniref:uncharacterized protein LOC128349879 n=1 Tax=Hemicordylus capensis TaxID=884348 RepID=UPI002304594D|nr:uncharacterized protein LOC128349879 [Hemicordylus capensis]